nr:MAG TPA: hypothetical protein [Caudoviricetes sp.]
MQIYRVLKLFNGKLSIFCTYVGLQISQTSISNIRFHIGSCE